MASGQSEPGEDQGCTETTFRKFAQERRTEDVASTPGKEFLIRAIPRQVKFVLLLDLHLGINA